MTWENYPQPAEPRPAPDLSWVTTEFIYTSKMRKLLAQVKKLGDRPIPPGEMAKSIGGLARCRRSHPQQIQCWDCAPDSMGRPRLPGCRHEHTHLALCLDCGQALT